MAALDGAAVPVGELAAGPMTTIGGRCARAGRCEMQLVAAAAG